MISGSNRNRKLFFGFTPCLTNVSRFPPRLRVLHAAPSTRATRLSVRPSGPRPRGGRSQDGEAGPQGGPLVPTHRGGVLLIGRPPRDEMRRLQEEEEVEGEQGGLTNGVMGGRERAGGRDGWGEEGSGGKHGRNILHLTRQLWI